MSKLIFLFAELLCAGAAHAQEQEIAPSFIVEAIRTSAPRYGIAHDGGVLPLRPRRLVGHCGQTDLRFDI